VTSKKTTCVFLSIITSIDVILDMIIDKEKQVVFTDVT